MRDDRTRAHPARRFAASVTTWSFRARVVTTAVVVAVLAFPTGQVVLWASDGDPRPAAFWFFCTGILAIPATLLLRSLWQPSADHERDAWAATQLERRLRRLDAELLAGTRPPDLRWRAREPGESLSPPRDDAPRRG